ncbi:MAG TPA: ABC transporter permease [Pyrinomonadaceae bacterium]|nr:ABC transporter permease [Chloracidobacterium sp.]MBP9108117.1 ABC transporter permease [Pyrinomonadaceae bacterium]MBK7802065.1 ABC transporter permease [Chloracidobacterium sp.]MBK9437789.1 ABC transporter permease [Chloracidobacterium sp.]MBL0239615.1 ABC transporter permease [Chloracidobacterium sp.]
MNKVFREILWPMVAVLAAFVVGGIIVLLIGDNPFVTFYHLIGNSFGSLNDIGYTLFIATPLIFTGLAVAVAFRCGLLNIGAEGQLYVAAFATAWVGIKFGGTVVTIFGKQEDWSWYSLPSVLLILVCMLTAVIAGGIWGAIPGILKAKFGSHEVINTIMLNFIGIALVSYFTQYYLKIPGDPILQTAEIGSGAHIPRISQYIPGMPDFVPLSVAFLIAILMCVLVYIFLWKTKWGYELRAVGENPSAAEYGGISAKKQIIIAMTISGGLAGMVAIGEVLGYRYRYYDGFSDGWGFLGIAVALLGRNHPLGIFVAAIFFAVLKRGEIFVDIETKYVSKDLVEVLQAIIIIFVASLQKFTRK